MITKKTEYAIRALWELAHADGVMITANQVAQRQSIPSNYLPQIIAELTRSGLIESTRGFGGGLKLGRVASSISLLDIIESTQGKLHLFECQVGETNCDRLSGCNLRDVYFRGQKALEDVFRSTGLLQLTLGKV